jgi:hypothetical protein
LLCIQHTLPGTDISEIDTQATIDKIKGFIRRIIRTMAITKPGGI